MRDGTARKGLGAVVVVLCTLASGGCMGEPKAFTRATKGHGSRRHPFGWVSLEAVPVPEPSIGDPGPAPAGPEVLLQEEFLHEVLEEGVDVRMRDALPERPSLSVSLRLIPPTEGAMEVLFFSTDTGDGSSDEPAVRVRVTGGPDPRLEAYVEGGWVALPGGIEREPGGLVRATFVLRAGGRLETSLPPGAPFTVPLAGGLPFPLSILFRGDAGGTVEGIEVVSP